MSVLEAEPEQITNAEPALERSECSTQKKTGRVLRSRDARVPLGERWKRRRLPKVCW
jgi:hypothetical protein